MGLYVSTVSGNVSLPDLGITLIHPVVDKDMGAQFSHIEIKKADSLTLAIQGGSLTWKKSIGGTQEAPSAYDDDFLITENLSTGSGNPYDRLLTFRDLVKLDEYVTSPGTITLDLSSKSVQIFTGTSPGQVIKLPAVNALLNGHRYDFINDSTQKIDVKNASDVVVFTINPSFRARALFVNGSWVFSLGSTTYMVAETIKKTNVVECTSDTEVLLPNMTKVPARGRYSILVSTYCTGNANMNVTFSIWVGGVRQPDTTIPIRIQNILGIMNDGTYICGLEADFDGTQTVEVKWKTSNNTAYCTGRMLQIIQVG